MRTNQVAETLLVLSALALLLGLRFFGLYSHQAFALVMMAGLAWAVVRGLWLARKGKLHTRLLHEWREPANAGLRWQVLARGFFWASLSVACLAVFPRSAEMWVLIGVVAIVGALRVAACFFPPRRLDPGPTIVMAMAGLILGVDLARGLTATPEPAVRLAQPFEGTWLVLQGGQSPMQNHHLSAYNQHWALDLASLDDGGKLFVDGEEGNSQVLAWEQPLFAPADGRIVFARDTVADAEGAHLVAEKEEAVGNAIVIETADGHFILFAHLREGSIVVEEGQSVSTGDPLARVGNSGNTTLPHLHVQVQTHLDLWDPSNRSIPFAFGDGGRVAARNDRIVGRPPTGGGGRGGPPASQESARPPGASEPSTR